MRLQRKLELFRFIKILQLTLCTNLRSKPELSSQTFLEYFFRKFDSVISSRPAVRYNLPHYLLDYCEHRILTVPQLHDQAVAPGSVFPSVKTVQLRRHSIQFLVGIIKLGEETLVGSLRVDILGFISKNIFDK